MGNFAADFVRKIFSRDRAKQGFSISNRDLAGGESGYRGGYGFDTLGIGGFREVTSIDKSRLGRYSDYEEMDEYGDISSALDIYSDDATQTDSEQNKTVWVNANDDEVKKELDWMFSKIEIEENIWEMARTLCKYGDEFEEIVIDDSGVINLNHMPSPTVSRVESGGETLGFYQTFSHNDASIDPKSFENMKLEMGGKKDPSGKISVFEDWRVVHMRLRSKRRQSLYGWAVTENARWIWKRLMLLEDAVMVYKLTRSPSRYAFYVDLGNLSPREGERALQRYKDALKKRKFINPTTGKMDMRFNPLSFDEDFFFGMRNGQEKTRVDVLNGPAYQQVDDVQYFLYKLYAALKVPRAYMGYDENMPSRATLSQEDVRFARTVLRVQRELRNGLKKVARVHLAARRMDPAYVDFDIKMTVPSSIFELGQMEVRRARADLASTMQAHVSLYWLLKNIYNFSDKDIEIIISQRKKDRKEMGGEMEDVSRIRDKELFEGRREDEKRLGDFLKREMEKHGSSLGRKLKENSMLLREIVASVSRK